MADTLVAAPHRAPAAATFQKSLPVTSKPERAVPAAASAPTGKKVATLWPLWFTWLPRIQTDWMVDPAMALKDSQASTSPVAWNRFASTVTPETAVDCSNAASETMSAAVLAV